MLRRSLIGVIVVALLLALTLPHRTDAQAFTPRARAGAAPNPSATPALPCWQSQAGPQMSYTPPPGLANVPRGGFPTPDAATIAQAQQFGMQAAAAAGYSFPSPTSTTPIRCPAAGDGSALLKAIWTAANAFRGTPTAWPGTSCGNPILGADHLGNCACAAAVQRIVYNATGQTIGSYSVDTWQNIAIVGRYGGGLVQPMASHAGDIIIWVDEHIGICANDGCTQTWSNSSSQSTFAPYTSTTTFGGLFTSYIIYEPQHIP